MYISRINPPIHQSVRTSSVTRRGTSSFHGLLEIEQLSEDAISAGGNTGERDPEREGTKQNPQKQPDRPALGGIDLKV
jgi:hypothetical protein